MKQWMQKLIDQLDYGGGEKGKVKAKVTEDRATLLYLIDVYNKHLIDIDTHPIRRVREELDGFAREIVSTERAELEKALFRFRQYFASYRVAEYTYIRKTFEDFKGIIWNFVEQLSEDFAREQAEDKEIQTSLNQLKEAVEMDSIDMLRARSKEFIHFYMDHHTRKETRRAKRLKGIKKNLDVMKKQLVEADRNLKLDHMTQAYNRRSFDEHLKQQGNLAQIEKTAVTLIVLDIDHFKKVNDTHGHDVGDVVIKECVRLLHESFNHEHDFVARVGGEEFAVILPEHAIPAAVKRADEALGKIRKNVLTHEGLELKFTVSMGIAQFYSGEAIDHWLKRADQALYDAKRLGRNCYTVSQPAPGVHQVA